MKERCILHPPLSSAFPQETKLVMTLPSSNQVIHGCSTMSAIYTLCIIIITPATIAQVLATGHNSLLNKHLKVAAETWNPFIIFFCNGKEISWQDTCPNKDNMTYGGAVWEIFKLVKLARNVTITIVRPEQYSWGDCKSPTDCDGMIGMVNRGEVDLAIGLLWGLFKILFYLLSTQIFASRSLHTKAF